jgi:ubiquitin-like 1-activating enzyme E1 A
MIEDESKRYDRQIRLWGWEAQKKLRTSHLCVVTSRIDGLTNELLKNVILAGVGQVTLISDHCMIDERDMACAFSLCTALQERHLTPKDIIGTSLVSLVGPLLQRLNPTVKIHMETDRNILLDETYLSSLDIVVMIHCGLKYMVSF